MKRYFQSSVSALAMSALVMGSVVVATVSITASPAFSKGNNSDNDNRNENSNRGGRDNSNRGNSNGRGSEASSLGALNAAHANANALANASENSRVGMIAIYKLAVEATADAAGLVEVAQAAYDDFVLAQFEDNGFISEYETYEDYLDATDPAPTADEIFHWETLKPLQDAIDAAKGTEEAAAEFEAKALTLAANKVTDGAVISALWDLLELPTE